MLESTCAGTRNINICVKTPPPSPHPKKEVTEKDHRKKSEIKLHETRENIQHIHQRRHNYLTSSECEKKGKTRICAPPPPSRLLSIFPDWHFKVDRPAHTSHVLFGGTPNLRVYFNAQSQSLGESTQKPMAHAAGIGHSRTAGRGRAPLLGVRTIAAVYRITPYLL